MPPRRLLPFLDCFFGFKRYLNVSLFSSCWSVRWIYVGLTFLHMPIDKGFPPTLFDDRYLFCWMQYTPPFLWTRPQGGCLRILVYYKYHQSGIRQGNAISVPELKEDKQHVEWEKNILKIYHHHNSSHCMFWNHGFECFCMNTSGDRVFWNIKNLMDYLRYAWMREISWLSLYNKLVVYSGRLIQW